jgi:hypothetical protein
MQHDQSCAGCDSLFGHLCADCPYYHSACEKRHDHMDKKDDRPSEHSQRHSSVDSRD